MQPIRLVTHLWCFVLAAGLSSPLCAQESPRRSASLGLDVRIPTAEEGRAFGLARSKGRWNGLFVTSVEDGGPSSEAGIRPGDVVVSAAENRIYSRDDLADVLRVSPPGVGLDVEVLRGGTLVRETVRATPGEGAAIPAGALEWQFAGLAQLDEALAEAKRASRPVLVGLSGADT